MIKIDLFCFDQLFSNISRHRVPCDDGTSLPLFDYHAMHLARHFPLVHGYIRLRYLFEDDPVCVDSACPDEEGYDNCEYVCAGDDEDIGDIPGSVLRSYALVDDVGRYY